MKFVILTISLILAFGYSDGTATTNSERCQKLTEFVARALPQMEKISWSMYESMKYKARGLGIDIENVAARNTVICKFAAAKTLRDMYEIIPDLEKEESLTYETVSTIYGHIQSGLSIYVGGYTNADRYTRISLELEAWGKQQNQTDNMTLKEKMDLSTLTNFLNVMQLRYGSRWMALAIGVKYQDFAIEDPEDFAKKIYEETSYKDVMRITGLEPTLAARLLLQLRGRAIPTYDERSRVWLPLGIEAFNLIGDMGFFNMEY